MRTLCIFMTSIGLLLGSANAFSFLSQQPQTPEEIVADLQQQQIDRPDDPELNYNLGVALYQGRKFDEAKTSFKRALEHNEKHKVLTSRIQFNLANTCYQKGVSQLPSQWQSQETIDPAVIDATITELKEALEHYQYFIDHEVENQKAQTNKKHTETIIKQLEKKKKQQQNQQQDKKNKDQQNKDKKDPQDKQDQQQKDQQQKQDQQQDQNKDQSNQEKQNQKQQDSSKKDQEGQRPDQGQQREEQSGRDQSADKPDHQPDQGKQDKLDGKQDKQKDQNDMNHTQPQEQQPATQAPGSESKQDEKEKQANAAQMQQTGQQQPEDNEMRRMRAMLENLQADQAQTQKKLFLQKTSQQNQPFREGQKPW